MSDKNKSFEFEHLLPAAEDTQSYGWEAIRDYLNHGAMVLEAIRGAELPAESRLEVLQEVMERCCDTSRALLKRKHFELQARQTATTPLSWIAPAGSNPDMDKEWCYLQARLLGYLTPATYSQNEVLTTWTYVMRPASMIKIPEKLLQWLVWPLNYLRTVARLNRSTSLLGIEVYRVYHRVTAHIGGPSFEVRENTPTELLKHIEGDLRMFEAPIRAVFDRYGGDALDFAAYFNGDKPPKHNQTPSRRLTVIGRCLRYLSASDMSERLKVVTGNKVCEMGSITGIGFKGMLDWQSPIITEISEPLYNEWFANQLWLELATRGQDVVMKNINKWGLATHFGTVIQPRSTHRLFGDLHDCLNDLSRCSDAFSAVEIVNAHRATLGITGPFLSGLYELHNGEQL